MQTPNDMVKRRIDLKLTELYEKRYLAAANAISEEYLNCCTEEDFAKLWEDIKEL